MMMRALLICALAATAAGCSPDVTGNVPAVTIVADNYCRVAKKRTWSVDDTRQSIDEARRENHKWDCLCTDIRGKPECKAFSGKVAAAE